MIPMAGHFKHRVRRAPRSVVAAADAFCAQYDDAAFTFLRVDGDVSAVGASSCAASPSSWRQVVMRIDKDDIATLHVPFPSMVQKVILEMVLAHLGWTWARLEMADRSVRCRLVVTSLSLRCHLVVTSLSP